MATKHCRPEIMLGQGKKVLEVVKILGSSEVSARRNISQRHHAICRFVLGSSCAHPRRPAGNAHVSDAPTVQDRVCDLLIMGEVVRAAYVA